MKKTPKTQKASVHSRKNSGILMGSIAMLLAPFAGYADTIVNGTVTVQSPGYLNGDGILQSGELKISIDGFSDPAPVAGMNSWFSASSLGLSNGASVSTWTDLSGNGHDATIQAGSLTYTENSVNGLPTVNFRSAGRNQLAGNMYAAQEYAVFTLPNGGDWGAILGSNDSNQGYLFNHEGYFWDGRYPRGVSKNGTPLSPNYNVGNNNGYMVIKIDNRNGNTNPTGGWKMGGQEGWNNFDMNLAEVITYDHDLNSTEENIVGGYLAGKYGITTSYTPQTGGPVTSGNLNLTSSNIIVQGSTILNAVTDGSANFGNLNVTSGVVELKGSPNGITFTATNVAASGNGGVLSDKAVTLGALSIANGGTFSVAGTGAVTTTGTSLSGASGAISVGAGQTFNPVSYNDGGTNKTLTFSGAGKVTIDNTTSAYVASATNIVVAGATVSAKGTSPLGGASGITLSGGELKLSLGGESNTLIAPSVLSGANARFDASTLGYSEGQSVDTWGDSSGNGHTATRQEGSMVYHANVINGLPTVQFNVNNDNSSALLSGSLNSKEQFVVWKANREWDWGSFLGNQNDRSGYMFRPNSGGNTAYFWDANYPQQVAKNGTVLGNNFTSGDYITGANQFMILNIVGNDNRTDVRGGYTLGRTEGWRGMPMDMAEVVSFDHVLSASEKADLGAYLATKYAINSTYGSASYAPLVSGSLNMSTTPVTVTADSTLTATTDGTATFGSLTINNGVATIKGAQVGVVFSGNTSLAAAATGGVAAQVPVNIGSLTINNGGTFVGSGPITSSSITLTGADGGLSTSGAFSVANYNDGASNKTLRLGGTGTITINNTANTFVAAHTTLRLTGATVDTTPTAAGSNDPLGGSTAIELAGGKLKLQGVTAVSTLNGLSANLYYIGNNAGTNLRFDQGTSLLGTTPIVSRVDNGRGSWIGGGISYGGDGAPDGFAALFPTQTQFDSFSVVWTGKWTAAQSGNYNITGQNLDDNYSVYVDLNQDHVFQSNELRFGNIGGEQSTFTLTSGQEYDVALGFGEGGGGNSVRFYLDTPSGSFNLNPSSGNQAGWWSTQAVAVGALNYTNRTVRVDASSEINAVTDSSANFGALTLNNGTLTLSGSPNMTFTGTTLTPGATQVGLSFDTNVTPNLGVINGSGATATFAKNGTGTYPLNNTGNTGLQNVTFDTQRGTLALMNVAGLGGSTSTKISGGQLLLSSDGGDKTYNVSVDVTQHGFGGSDHAELNAGNYAAGGGVDGATITLGSGSNTLTVRNGKRLDVNTFNNYTLNLRDSINLEDNSTLRIGNDNVNLDIYGSATLTMGNNSTINLDEGRMRTDHAISVYNLNVNGGSIAFELNGATPADRALNVNNRLYIDNPSVNLSFTNGASLTTSGGATVEVNRGTLSTDAALTVGNLRLNHDAIFSRTGTGANASLTIGNTLHLANQTINTAATNSQLHVDNRIEVQDHSTLTYNNSFTTNSIYVDDHSVMNPGAGTTTTINDYIQVSNHSSVNFTGATLALGNRFYLNDNSTLTIANNLSLNGNSEVYNGSVVDFGTNTLNTNFHELRLEGTGDNGVKAEIKAMSSPTLNLNYLYLANGGTLSVPDVNISDRIELRGTHAAFNIHENSGGRYMLVYRNGVSDYTNPNSISYLTGTNTYTGETWMREHSVLVAVDGVSLPSTTNLRFWDGGGSGGIFGTTTSTFSRTLGAAPGQIGFWGMGGFAAYGATPLSVSLNTPESSSNPQLNFGSDDSHGFQGQPLALGAAYDTHDVTLTNAINLNNGDNYFRAYSREHLGILSGNLTGGGNLRKDEGAGALALTGDNSGYTGTIIINQGAIDAGLNFAGLGGANRVQFEQNTGDPWNYGAANLQGYGNISKNIGQGAGELYWENRGGGFSARGGALNVTLEGGATLNWQDGGSGFNGRGLMFGSFTADNVVTLTNNIDGQDANNNYDGQNHQITVIGNPNSANDKAVLSGTLTNFRGLQIHGAGGGVLEIPGNFTAIRNDQLRIYGDNTPANITGTTLRVLGNLRTGDLDGNTDPRYYQRAVNSVEMYQNSSLYVTGNLEANNFYSDGGNWPNKTINITGNVTLRNRMDFHSGTTTIAGNFIAGGENGEMYVNDYAKVTVNGNFQFGIPQTNSRGAYADRNLYIQNGGDLTVNGTLKANYLEIHSNGDGRGGNLHVNGAAVFGERISHNHHNGATSGGFLDGSGSISTGYIDVDRHSTLGGTLTVTVDSGNWVNVYGSEDGGRIAPGPELGGAGKLTINRLNMHGDSRYIYDGGDLVDVTSMLRLEDNWKLDLMSTGARLTTGGSLKLFKVSTTPEAYDDTPQYNVSSLITAGWIPNNFDTGSLSLTNTGGYIYLNGLKLRPPTWTGGGADNNWTTGNNWDLPLEAGNPIIFAGNTRTSPNNDFTAGTSFISLEFDNTAASFTVGGNRINLTEGITNNSSNAQTINMPMTIAPTSTVNTGAQNMTINGNLDGTGGVLTKSGSGTLYLAGNNTMTGGVGINEGTVSVATGTALGGAGASVRFNGGTLAVTAPISSPAGLAVNTTGTLAIGGNAVTFSGTNTGSGTLTKTGGGTLTLSGTGSTFSGTINVTQGALAGSAASISSNVALSGGTSVTFNQTVNGNYGKDVSGTGSLIKTGAAILDLKKASTLSGETLISEGTIRFNSSAPVASGMTSWFDAGNGVTVDGNSRITQWNDLSGSNHGSINYGNGGATLVTNGINGLPTAKFRNNWMDLNGTMNVGSSFIVFKSGRYQDDPGNPNSWHPDWTAPIGRIDGGSWMMQAGTRQFWDGNDPVAVSRNGTSVDHFNGNGRWGLDNVADYMVLKVDSNRIEDRQYRLGANGGWTNGYMDVAEIITYDHNVNSTEELAIGQYLSGKYNLNTAYGQGGNSSLPNSPVNIGAAGTLDVNGVAASIAGLSGSGTVALNGGTLTINSAANSAFSGAITATGGGSLVKGGAAKLTLSGTNGTLTSTTVTGGTLLLNSALTSPVSVASGTNNTTATLGGNSTITGNVTLAAASNGRVSRITGGDIGTVDTLTISGGLSFGAGAVGYFDYVGNAIDYFNVTGALTAANGTIIQVPVDSLGFGTYSLIGFGSTSSSIGNFLLQDTTGTSAPGTFGLSYVGNVLKLNITSNNRRWDGAAGDNNWSSGNWTGAASPVNGDVVTFAGTTRTSPNNDQTGRSLSAITFDTNAGAFTLGGNDITLNGNIRNKSTNNQTVAMNVDLPGASAMNAESGDITISGILSGAGAMTKIGDSALILTGNNTRTGVTTLTAGALSVGTIGNGGSSTNLGAATSAAANLVFNGGTLRYTGATASTDRNFTINAGKVAFFDIFHDTTNLTVSGAAAATNGGLTKSGAGTMTITNNQVYTGVTTVSGGTLSVGNGGTLPTLATSGITLANSANVTLNHSDNITYNTVVNGTGSFTKAGSGTLLMKAAQSYDGATVISNGTVKLKEGSSTAGIQETFFNAQHEEDARSNIEGMRALSVGTDDGRGISTNQIGVPDDGTADSRAAAYGAVGFDSDNYSALWLTTFNPNATGQWNFHFDNSDDQVGFWIDKDQNGIFSQSGANGNERIMYRDGCCAGADGNWSEVVAGEHYLMGLTLGDGGGGGYLTGFRFESPAGGGMVDLNPSLSGQGNLWTVGSFDGGNDRLPVTSALSIASGGILDMGGANQQVASLANSNGSGGSITNSSAYTDSVLTISAASGSTDFGGVISDGATKKTSLVKAGASTQILSGANTYTGDTTVSGGTLQIGNGGNTGSISVNSAVSVTGTGSLAFNRSDVVSFSNVITGDGNLTQAGSGTLKVVADSHASFTGTVTVSAGTLVVNGSLSGSTMTTVNGGQLGGDGGQIGPVTVNSGGAINAGDPTSNSGIGSLTVNGNLVFTGTSQFKAQYDSSNLGLGYDQVNVSANLNIASGTVLNVTDLATSSVSLYDSQPGTSITLIDYDTITPGSAFAGLADGAVFTVGANQWQISYDGLDNMSTDVTLTVVPEPGAAVSLLGGLGMLLSLRRRRK